MGVRDSSHSHVDSMCGDGQSKTNDTFFAFFIHFNHRISVPSIGLRHYMEASLLETCSLSHSHHFCHMQSMRLEKLQSQM